MDNINYERLRKDLIDYYGSALPFGFGVAAIEIEKIKRASNYELLAIARKCNFDLNDYKINTYVKFM